MAYLHEAKDPQEKITVGFDFSAITETPTTPTIQIALRWGSESPITLTAYGVPYIVDATVFQQFVGGADLNDYDLKCFSNTPEGDKIAVDCTLAVRNQPV